MNWPDGPTARIARRPVFAFDHVRSVALRVCDNPDPYAVIAAVLHDSVEKGPFGWADLQAAGADARLIGLVDALTERAKELEADHLVRCAADPLALRIKRAHITDKLDVVPGSNINNSDVAELKRRARRRLAILDQVAAADGP